MGGEAAVAAVDPARRLGAFVGYLTLEEMQQIDTALLRVLDLLSRVRVKTDTTFRESIGRSLATLQPGSPAC